MPSVPFKYVVSFTSQDERHPVNNLIDADVFKKWLSHPQDRTGVMEAILQLEYPCIISYINIDSFCSDVAKKKWDRIKVICRQPYKKTSQFGLSFLHVKTSESVQPLTASGNERLEMASLVSSTVSSIKQHFLGRIQNSESKSDKDLKSKLLKIAASADGGGEGEGVLSRTAKLVLAASKGLTKPANHPPKTPDNVKRGMYSNHLDKKYGPQFEEEVGAFLSKLSVNVTELDNVTLADVRHRFERKLRRKLTKEEKKIFAELTTKALSAIFNDDSDVPTRIKHKASVENVKPCHGKENGTVVSPISAITTQTPNQKPSSKIVDLSELSTSNQNHSSLSNGKPNGISTANQKVLSMIDNKPIGTSTPNHKTSVPTDNNYSSKNGVDAEKWRTPNGKRKLNACDDVITPPSKKKVTGKGVPLKSKQKSTESSPSVLKAKNCVNEILKRKEIQNQKCSKGTSFLEGNEMKEELNPGKGHHILNVQTPERTITNMDKRIIHAVKNTPIKDSSFGEFLLNVSLTQSDIDDDEDDEILFPKQKVPKRGKGRSRGTKKKKTQNDCDSPLVSPSGSGRGNQQRGCGGGKQGNTQRRSNLNSLEVRPTGFAKCDGCSDYFGAELLAIHQEKCLSWKNKQNSLETSETPWLCTRPETPGSSSKDGTGIKGQRSPPWVMAALAAERRLNKGKGLDQGVSESDVNFTTTEDASNRVTGCGEISRKVIEEQQKGFEQFSPMHIRKSKSNIRSENQSENLNSQKRNKSKGNIQLVPNSNLSNQSVSKTINRNQSVSGRVSNNQSGASNISNNQSMASIGGCFDLTMSDNDSSDSDSRDSLMGNMVECPLCGTLLPSNVIEVHAAHCGL